MQELLDREWRLNNLYRIKDKDGNVILFKKNKAQEHFDKNKHSKNIILKSRQLGFSTWECIDQLDEVLFSTEEVKENMIIGHTREAVEDMFSNKIHFAWSNFPRGLKSAYLVKSESAKVMEFGTCGLASTVFNKISVQNTARSGSPTRIHVTELSYLDKLYSGRSEEILRGGLPAVPAGEKGRFDIESTARGNSGNFYDICMRALERQKQKRPITHSDFKLHFYNWTWDEYRIGKTSPAMIEHAKEHFPNILREYFNKLYKEDNLEFDWLQKSTYYYIFLSLDQSHERTKQEYPTTIVEAFEASEDTLFDTEKLAEQQIIGGRKINSWEYFKDPKQDHVYAIGCDVSEGVGGHSSTITILDCTTPIPETVAQYEDKNTAPDDFAYEIATGGRMYNMALAGVERNNHGHTTLSKLREIYPENRIYQEIKKDKERDVHTRKWGWDTNKFSKPKMLYDLNAAINAGMIRINDKNMIQEMRTYSRENVARTTDRAGQTKHWDRLMGLAIAYQLRNDAMAYKVIDSKVINDNLQKELDSIPKSYL